MWNCDWSFGAEILFRTSDDSVVLQLGIRICHADAVYVCFPALGKVQRVFSSLFGQCKTSLCGPKNTTAVIR